MVMAATKVWTLRELDSLPDDGNVYELIRGELFVSPPPTYDHETIAARLTRILVAGRRFRSSDSGGGRNLLTGVR